MKAEFEKLIVSVIVLVMSLAGVVANADLVAHWGLDGNAGDSIGSNHGTLVGDPQWVAGYFNGALYFDGDGDAVDLGNADVFNFTGSFSISVWANIEAWNQGNWNNVLVGKGGEGASWQLRKHGTSDFLTFTIRGTTGGPDPQGTIAPTHGEWHHIVAIYDADAETRTVYIDNVLDVQITSGGEHTPDDNRVYIGARSLGGDAGPTSFFQGTIDDVCIFSRALTQAEIRQLCKLGGKSFISEELRVMNSAVREAERLLKEQRPEKAVGFLEKRIAEYEQWKEKNPNHLTVSHELRSSDLYFLLAKAKEAANKPRHAVAAAYKKTALVSMRQTKYVSALLWLFNNIPAADYVDVVKKSVRSGDNASDNIHHIAKDFESRGNWPAFKLFLDVIFSEVNDTTSYAEAIAESLKKNGVWANNFSKYCRSKPELTEYVIEINEELAQEHIRQEEFLKAAEIYRDIVNQCGSDQDKTIYELKVCECIFNSGQYTSAIPELNRFIRNNKATNRVLVKQAILLKGRAYVQLGEMGRAYNTFLELMIDYPETKQAPEANFFIGYCNMLQGKYKEATEALNMVVKNYPQSSYASKARLCLTRIKRMTE